MDDAAIIALYQRRDEQAIRETEAAYGALCNQIAYHITESREDAEECVSEGLLRLWNAIPPACPENLGGYFVTAVRNIALNRRAEAHAGRRGGGQTPLSYEELSPYIAAKDGTEQAVDRNALADALRRFLAGLSADARAFFISRYWLSLPVSEIAKQCGCSAGSVKMSLLRTRKKLRTFLEKEGFL